MDTSVSALFKKGLDENDQIIGVHGTAWESVAVMHNTGFFPPTLNKGLDRSGFGNDHRDGCVYFFPLQGHFPDHKNSEYFPDNLKNAVDAARIGYANRIAREMAIITIFDLDVSSPTIRDLADRATRQRPSRFESLKTFFKNCKSDDLYKILTHKGYSDVEIKNALMEASQREGIILAIRKTALSVFELHEDATDREALAIVCPAGLPIEHISGIEPCGDYEYGQLDALE